jgi:YD repeat-containing protein
VRRATLLLLPLMGLFSTGFAGAQLSVSSLNDPGSPVYSVQIPVENGYIDVSNGNLHLEFPLVAPKQRGAVSLNEKVVYDSRIWMFSPFGSYGSYHWWPYNVYGGSTSSGGWRLVTSANPGSMSVSGSIYTWTDPTGISHTFDPSSGWAADGSGYSITFGIGPNGYIVKDSAGAMVWPYVADQYGNYVGPNGNGDVVDDTGRVPVITTTSGSTTYYDVVAPNGTINNNGTRVRYTVTTAPVPVSTDFAQSDIYEWISSNLLTPVQSIQLPDGSEYSFTYDGYGELASMTLPTGGVIQYGYGNYVDSTYTANRWLTSWTVGSNPSMTFTPSAIINCENYSSGCVEQINVVKPSGDETVYQLTLNNGAWNTEISTYTGALGVLNVQSANVFNFGTSCPTSVCNGSEYITKSLETTTLPMYINGVATSLNTYEQSVYANPETSQLTALREWDYS